jgi:hypothetical protein
VLENLLLQKQPVLREAATPETEPEDRSDGAFDSGPIMPNRQRNHDRKVEEAARKRHERLVRQWEAIRRLYLAGADLRHICRQLGISARTVYRYKDLTEPPPRRAYKRRASVLDPYVPYLALRDGTRAATSARSSTARSARGVTINSEEICARFTAQLRRAEAQGKPPSSVPRARKSSVAGLSPTSKNVAALFMRREEKLNEEQKEYPKRLCEADEALADARRLTQEFKTMVRNLEGEKLNGWLEEAEACGAPAMRHFALGLEKDLPAVRAGRTETWSNGPVEGFVHKLKLLKRQGDKAGGLRSAKGEDAGRLKTARRAARDGTYRFTKKPTEPAVYGEVSTGVRGDTAHYFCIKTGRVRRRESDAHEEEAVLPDRHEPLCAVGRGGLPRHYRNRALRRGFVVGYDVIMGTHGANDLRSGPGGDLMASGALRALRQRTRPLRASRRGPGATTSSTR